MALSDSAVVVPGTGNIYVADKDEAFPNDLDSIPVDWVNVGHTSIEGLTMTFEIESEALRTWQSPAGVRSSTTGITFEVAFTAHQVDEVVLPLFFGGGAPDGVTGRFGVTKSPAPVSKALLIVMEDGANVWPFYAASVEFRGAGEIEANPEGLL